MYFTRVMLCLVFATILRHTKQNQGDVNPQKLPISCFNYKTNNTSCRLGYVKDALTSECIPICDSDCYEGECEHIFCVDEIPPRAPTLCHHFYCSKNLINYCCGILYVNNPYNIQECIPRCINNKECGNGSCIDGLCKCLEGYRLNPRNGRFCIEEPPRSVEPIDATSLLKIVNNSLKEEMMSNNKMYDAVIGSLILSTLVLLTVIAILIFMIITVKRITHSPNKSAPVHHYSMRELVPSKANNELIVENQELYMEAS